VERAAIREPARVPASRVTFAAAGWVLAIVGLTRFHAADAHVYVAYFSLSVLFTFVNLDSAIAFPLPYLATSCAFAYIVGLPVITLSYATRIITLPLLLTFASRGLVSAPDVVLALGKSPGPPEGRWATHVDLWARMAMGALGLAVRATVFVLMRRRWPHAHPITAVLCAEALAQVVVAAVPFVLPLPTIERFAQRLPWRLELDDERIDAIYAWALFLPLFVVLIYYGYLAHGLPGAAGWSVATLGPHYLLKLLNDRRHRLARNATALEQLNVALQRKQRELSEFVYTVTHDLKSPVNAILLTADEALDREGEELTDETRGDLEQIARMAETTEHIIGDLLGLFRITSTEEPVADVSLQAVVASALDKLQAQVGAKRIRVTVGELPMVRGQATKLEHAVANLLSNAVKYVPRGAGVVAVSAEERDGDTTLCVRDNGVGIEPRYHRTIFELFTRVPAAGQLVDGAEVDGTGVGLAIVKRVVEEHGGRVWVESAVGTGSAFYLLLPSTSPQPRSETPGQAA
jgi:signal transduction histidine kinase